MRIDLIHGYKCHRCRRPFSYLLTHTQRFIDADATHIPSHLIASHLYMFRHTHAQYISQITSAKIEPSAENSGRILFVTFQHLSRSCVIRYFNNGNAFHAFTLEMTPASRQQFTNTQTNSTVLKNLKTFCHMQYD